MEYLDLSVEKKVAIIDFLNTYLKGLNDPTKEEMRLFYIESVKKNLDVKYSNINNIDSSLRTFTDSQIDYLIDKSIELISFVGNPKQDDITLLLMLLYRVWDRDKITAKVLIKWNNKPNDKTTSNKGCFSLLVILIIFTITILL